MKKTQLLSHQKNDTTKKINSADAKKPVRIQVVMVLNRNCWAHYTFCHRSIIPLKQVSLALIKRNLQQGNWTPSAVNLGTLLISIYL